MIPRGPLGDAFSDPNLLGTAIAGDTWKLLAHTADCGHERRPQRGRARDFYPSDRPRGLEDRPPLRSRHLQAHK